MRSSIKILFAAVIGFPNLCFSIKTKILNPAVQGTWSNRQGLTLTPVAQSVWAAERPFLWNGIDVGGRSVIVRTSDGNLLVHSPVEWTENLGRALDQLGGEIKYVVSPNYEHLKYAEQWAKQYPNALKCACPGLPERMPSINWNMEIGVDESENLLQTLAGIDFVHFDCEINPFTSRPFFNEIVFFHEKSRTVFMSDTFWNYPRSSRPNYADLESSETGTVHVCSKVPTGNCPGDLLPEVKVPFGTALWKIGMDKIYLPFYKRFMIGTTGERRRRYEKAVEKVIGWEADLIVPCHGDVIKGRQLCRTVLHQHFY